MRGVDLEVGPGEVVALVGESGSGKTVSALALLDLLPRTARVQMDAGVLAGHDLTRIGEHGLRDLRGSQVGMIFQDPLSSLNPVQKVGAQIAEAVRLQRGLRGRAAKQAAIELLTQVGIPDPAARYDEYPHQFSGGMRQRAMIAIALAGSPPLLIADEPTTALDVTVQAQILELIAELQAKHQMGVLMITHDLGVVAGIADRVYVMYAGRVVETGATTDVLRTPRHRYTLGLLRSLPRLDATRGAPLVAIEGAPPDLATSTEGCDFAPRCPAATERCTTRPPLEQVDERVVACWHPAAAADAAPAPADPAAGPADAAAEALLTVASLSVIYSGGRRLLPGGPAPVAAVNEVGLEVAAGTTLGLVGESGCGKTTLGRAIVRLLEPESGSVKVAGRELVGLSERELRPLRRDFQIIFQDPRASLNPRHRIREILSEPLELHHIASTPEARARRVDELIDLVGLRREFASRRPHELSGGQRQRVGIARALAVEPKLLVLDEAVSALDVSVRAQILNLLERLQAELGLTYVFIAHDLAVVRHIAERVAVMYVGKIVEDGPSEQLFASPAHPYTAALLSAVPIPDAERERRRERIVLQGDPVDPRRLPKGCPFQARCWLREQLGNPARCTDEAPGLAPTGAGGQRVACHFTADLDAHLPPGALGRQSGAAA